ncbi:MAG TPA: peptidylprolyl isomerase [Candidatus Limnocylindrales bacterium]|nr:peptidylprolyl isomerase [Candidatus Limnocylindrales bacterium]
MTFRAKPVANKPRRQSREGESRRNLYLNVGFGLAVVSAVVILVGVAVVSYYSEHLAPAASVGGQTITKDDFTEQAQIEVWRLQQQRSRIEAALNAGHITSAQAQQQIQSLQQQAQAQALTPQVLERLIDTKIQGDLAKEMGISATPEQIDAKIVEESTTPEERHAWIIAVRPEVDDGKDEPTAEQKAAAKKIADQALVDVTTGGKKWEDVAKSVSTDASASTGGDLGWISKDAVEDPKWLDAVFAAEKDKPTAVIEGDNGDYLIGKVTDIAPATVDQAWTEKLKDAGLKEDVYREAVAAEVIREMLEDKAIADAEASDKQRHILELALQAPSQALAADAVKVRHILFSPYDDPDKAQTLPADDPGWSEAQLAADKAFDELQKDPAKFDEMARAESDETSAQGETGTGGKLGWVDSSTNFVQEFKDAVLKEGLKDGQVLQPFKTAFGWHVAQIMYHPPDADEIAKLRDEIASGKAKFEDVARDYSDGNEAGKGGDKGWVAPGLMDARLLRDIYATPVGELSQVVDIKDGGLFLYKVLEERTQKPDAEQTDTIKARAFQNWYGEKKDAVTVTRQLLDDLQLS